MNGIKVEDLEIKIVDSGSSVTMEWLGKSRGNPNAVLLKYFDSILEDLIGKKLTIEFRNLDFMSSSTVTSIVRLVKSLEDKNIKAEINYMKDSEWQNASFIALATITRNMEHIAVNGL